MLDSMVTISVISAFRPQLSSSPCCSGIDPILGYAANVINKYFTVYFPKAIDTAEQLAKRGGPEQLIYTTHAWLVSFYLDCNGLPSVPRWNATVTCPSAAAVARFENAIANGWITWHAFPFNGEAELMDAAMLRFGVQMAHDLDRRFHNGTLRRVVSQRDVPGLTRASIPLWRAAGVDMISVGVNGGSAPPGVPRQFVWRDALSNTSILATWHPSGYGGHTVVDFAVAPMTGHVLVPFFKGDNAGPPSVAEVLAVFQLVRAEVPPTAQVFASTFDAFAVQLESSRALLPVVESEIGDTWIHGAQADPLRQAKFRAAMRARTACENAGLCDPHEARYHNFSRILIKAAEHTFGGDKKKFVHDWTNWSNAAFERVRGTDIWQRYIASWAEQRSFIDIAVDALGSHPLAAKIAAAFAELEPAPAASLSGFTKANGLSFMCGGTTKVTFNGTAGGIAQLNGASGQLAQFAYQSLNQSDYTRFFGTYCNCAILHIICQQWAQMDFTPIGLQLFANPESRTWLGDLVGAPLWQNSSNPCHFRQLLSLDGNAVTNYGAPAFVQQDFVVGAAEVDVSVTLFNKTATRIPETVWLVFDVDGGDEWNIEKMGELVDVHDVVLNGSARNHAITAAYSRSGLTLSSRDVALATIGERFALPTVAVPATQTDKSRLSFVIRDNLWQTNYPDISPFVPGENLAVRFQIKV